MSHRMLLAAVVGWVAITQSAQPASAYCLSASCADRNDGKVCVPAELDDCDGAGLRWRSGCVGFTVQEDGSEQVSFGVAANAARAAFAAWENADCGGATPGIHVAYMGRATCTELEYNKSAGNANIVVFRDAGWPYPDDTHSVAKTTTTFDPDTGALVDADIEINSSHFILTTSDVTEQYDLQSVLTHEAGHFLGLGHSAESDATMFAVYQAGVTALRELSTDDIAAVCAAYPPRAVSDDCNPLPKHGFEPDCEDDQRHVECAARPGPASGAAMLWLLGCALFAITVRSGRRDRS